MKLLRADWNTMWRRLLSIALVGLLIAGCGASDEQLRLAFLQENPMASATLPFGEQVGRSDVEGEFDPFLGSPSTPQILMRWELDDDEQIEEAVGLLVAQAEEAGFDLEQRRAIVLGYEGFDTDRTRLTIASGLSTDTRPARVSLQLQ